MDFVLDSTLESADAAEKLVLEAATAMGFDEEQQYQIGLAVHEAVVNAVLHGNCYSDQKKVRLSVSTAPDRLTILVADEGRGFDPAQVPDPLEPEKLMSRSGRGILLIRAFVDEFEIRQREPNGTEFRLVKYLTASE